MKLPKIAIIGRPNVGKSALFNRICNKRIAIVDEEEGVTRDRLYIECDFFTKHFELIDTGGIDPYSKLPLSEQIIEQAKIGAEEADSVIMVVDGKVGPTLVDEAVAKYIFTLKKPVILAVNKVDEESQNVYIHSFYSLGIKKIMGVSALHGFQLEELLEEALKDFPAGEKSVKSTRPKVSIIGSCNVGKSTLLNCLLNERRSLVSSVAGTTRDQIDALYIDGDKEYTLIDTAGIRRKQKEKDVIEKFASIRTKKAIERADVCLFMVDVQQGLLTQEKKALSLIEENRKGCIILLNKWDLIKGQRMEHALQDLQEKNGFLKHCPTLVISAKMGRNLEKIFPLVDQVFGYLHQKVPTPKLNTFIEKAMQLCHPPMIDGKRLRIYYITQLSVAPPRFALFVNYPHLFSESYKKYLINQFRKTFGFDGVFIDFEIRGKEGKNYKEQPK